MGLLRATASWLRESIGFNPVTWARAVPRVRKLVAELAAQRPDPSTGTRCLVVILPWLGTSIPLFTLAIGMMLRRKGVDVTFALDTHRFGPNPMRHAAVSGALRRIMRSVAPMVRVIDVDGLARKPLTAEARADIARLAALNATWTLRGEMLQAGRASAEATYRAQIENAYGAIAAAVEQADFDLIFVPGGIFGLSGVWSRLAREKGARVSTFDAGGYETTMLAVDGLACQLGDVPRAFETISARIAGAPAEAAAVLARAEGEVSKRKTGSDVFESQIRGGGAGSAGLEGGVLIALNSSWDAAALGNHRIFAGNSEWIVETVRFLLANTEAPVIVRQHPAERLEFARTSDDYAGLLTTHFADHPRLHFIAAADPVNSYALLDRVSAVVVHSSTMGIEAVAYGRPVITGSNAYYAGFGFVHGAADRADYERTLLAAARGELGVTEQMRKDAYCCFYVTQCCNWTFSPFNPADYAKWSVRPLSEWLESAPVARMIEAIADNRPVAELNHDAMMAAELAG